MTEQWTRAGADRTPQTRHSELTIAGVAGAADRAEQATAGAPPRGEGV